MSGSTMQGPPYPPRTAGVGGTPTVSLDIPICAVFLLLYAGAAAGHQTIFQMNRRKGHKFIISLALFGFCMARIMTCVLRMAWATHLTNISLAIAANIFVSAGILIVYIVNFLLVQRIIRAMHPRFGWHPVARIIPKILYALFVVALAVVISFSVLSFYTLDQSLLNASRDASKAAITYLLLFVLLPVILLPFTFFRGQGSYDFAQGGMTAKIAIVSVSSLLCLVEQTYRAGTTWAPPRPTNNPGWWHGKAAFYSFDFAIEIIVIYFLLLTRIDRRFHVPDGSSKRKHYHDEQNETIEKGLDRESAEI